MIIDLQRTPGMGICASCDGPCIVKQNGTCEACGSDSVIRPFSLATRLNRRMNLDPKFYRRRSA